MTIPPSLSREPSRSSLAQSFRSRRRSFESNDDDNVFSDEYAHDFPPARNHAPSPLGSFPLPRQQYFDDPFRDPAQTEHEPLNTSNAEISHPQPERTSTAKTRLMIDDLPSSSGQGLGRALSTSSRLTIPRSDSPYRGPSAPSHPYAMYPQMTRAASVASQSTFRSVPDSSFIARSRPEHPYHMYPQNTVEGEDEDITTNGIPLGFPRSTGFQSSSDGSSGEVGDIIHINGHVEQLPPYTRYADNTVAKGNMDDIMGRRASQASRVSRVPTQVSEPTTNPIAPSETASTTLLQPREQFEHDTEDQVARKEGWRDRATKRTVGGMPVWGVILIVLSILFSAIIGGIVGGVIGNKQGAERGYAAGATTTTMYIDAVPTTLGPNSSPLPTGHFQIPLNQSEEIKQCIEDQQYSAAWGCMDLAYIGVLVFEDTDPETGNASMKAVFEDFSIKSQDFKYGPQPPDFNGSAFTLNPMSDKDAGELGVAMFFSVQFDKLSIIPEDVLEVPPANKRDVAAKLDTRGTAPYDGQPLEPSHRPWFCFWNSTMNEFFIYVNQPAPAEPTSTSYKDYVYSTSSPTPTNYLSTTSDMLMQELTMTTSPTPSPTSTSATTFAAYNPVFTGRPTGTTPVKRSYETSAPDMKDYPKLIKMVEKRKPADDTIEHVQPYCQKMQVLDDWSIVPILDVPTICIEELQYPTTSLDARRKLAKKDQRDVVGDLGSFCICEWTST